MSIECEAYWGNLNIAFGNLLLAFSFPMTYEDALEGSQKLIAKSLKQAICHILK